MTRFKTSCRLQGLLDTKNNNTSMVAAVDDDFFWVCIYITENFQSLQSIEIKFNFRILTGWLEISIISQGKFDPIVAVDLHIIKVVIP